MTEQLYRIIGSRIKALRKDNKMSQNELANFCNLTRSSFSQIESGKQKISIEHLYTVCEVLQCDVFDILPSSKNIEIDNITNIRLDSTAIDKAKIEIEKILEKTL